MPIPGAARLATASSLARVLAIALDDEDRHLLDARFSGRLLRVPRAERRRRAGAEGDVVIAMGMPGAGKPQLARELVASGYERLNRDAAGGSLADLCPPRGGADRCGTSTHRPGQHVSNAKVADRGDRSRLAAGRASALCLADDRRRQCTGEQHQQHARRARIAAVAGGDS